MFMIFFAHSDKAVALSPSPHLYSSSLYFQYTSTSDVPRMMRNHPGGSTQLSSGFSFLQKLNLTQSISDSLSHTAFVSTRGHENTTGVGDWQRLSVCKSNVVLYCIENAIKIAHKYVLLSGGTEDLTV